MGYDIYIGEARIDGEHHDEEITVDVGSVTLAEAPAFPNDVRSDHVNHRHPSYTGWVDWTETVGLHSMFFDVDAGLMRAHPGTFRLLPEHLDKIAKALKKWRAAHPYAEPGWCGCMICAPMFEKHDALHVERDGQLARLMWLEWWVRWALANCKMPCIHNH